MKIIKLTTNRLYLREFQIEDWRAVHAYASQPEVHRFQPWEPSTPDSATRYVQYAIEQAQGQPRKEYVLAIEIREQQQVIGSCQLTIHNAQFQIGEIGYFLNSDYWGFGYATEAARALLEFGFSDLSLHRVFAQCDPRNRASIRVLERLGMQYEGHLRETMLIRDGWRDSLMYSLLVHEWTKVSEAFKKKGGSCVR